MPDPGPGVCLVCRGPGPGDQRVCFACRVVARRLGLPLAPVTPVRLCPLPSPLYTVLLGYKESPVAEARLRFGAMVRMLVRSFLLGDAGRLEATIGGRFDLVALVPSTRRPGIAPLGLVDGLGHDAAAALPAAHWAADLLRRRRRTWRAAARRAHATRSGGLQCACAGASRGRRSAGAPP